MRDDGGEAGEAMTAADIRASGNEERDTRAHQEEARGKQPVRPCSLLVTKQLHTQKRIPSIMKAGKRLNQRNQPGRSFKARWSLVCFSFPSLSAPLSASLGSLDVAEHKKSCIDFYFKLTF